MPRDSVFRAAQLRHMAIKMAIREGEYTNFDKDAVMQCRALRKTYFQGDSRIDAVNDVYLTVQRGQFIAITGASGSGKSTLLHILGGFDPPTSGEVFVCGEEIYSMKDAAFSAFRCRRTGFVFQSFNLLPVLTAKENILMPQKIAGETHYPAYFDQLTRMLRIDDRLDHLPSELSGGQQQRVAVARALINRPDVLFADEPAGNLDRASAEELMRLLLQARAEFNQTLVMVTHDLSLAKSADRIYEMNDGMLSDATNRLRVI